MKKLEEEKLRLQKDIQERRAEFESKAKQIIAGLAGKEKKEIKAALIEAKIPKLIIYQLLPT